MEKTFRKNQILLNLSYIFIVFSLAYVFALGINLELSIFKQIAIVGLASLIVKFLLFNPLVLYIVLIFISLAILIIEKYFLPIIIDLLEYFYMLFLNIVANIQGKENIFPENIFSYWIILIAIVSIFTAYLMFKKNKTNYIVPVYLFAFLYYWYNYYDEAIYMLSIFLISYFIYVGLNKYNNKENIDPNLWLKTALFYSIIIVLLSFYMPKSNFYFRWDYLQDKITTYFPFVEELRHNDIYLRDNEEAKPFDFSMSGFQNRSSRLGGPVILDDTKIMTIKSDKPLYLRGNIRLYYNGNSWRSGEDSFEKYKSNRGFNLLSNEDLIYYEEKSINIKFENYSSTSVFTPYLPKSMYFNESLPLFLDKDYAILFPEGIYKREIYSIEYYNLLPINTLLSLGINNSKEELEKIEDYLQLPKNQISNNTKALTKDIVKNAESDYEKALAIEDYLRNNYKYSLEVNQVPEGNEFIDYFLFHEEKGYCTYFATTMAIMLRLEGIPSRYIEGYLVKDEIDPDIYEVKNQNAHTWVEGFIEPIGWMSFEPTPVFPRENRRLIPLDEEVNPSTNRDLEEILIEEPPKSPRDTFIEDTIDEYKAKDEVILEEVVNENERNYSFILIVILIIFSIRIILGLIIRFYRAYNYKKLPNHDKIIYLYKDILDNGHLFNYPILSGETHFEYAARVANKFSYYDEFNIKNITNIFVKTKYSLDPSSLEEINFFEEFLKIQNKHLKRYLGPLKYFANKYKIK